LGFYEGCPFFTISQAIVLLYIFDESRLRNLIKKHNNFTDDIPPSKSYNVKFVLEKAQKLLPENLIIECAQSNNQGKLTNNHLIACIEKFKLNASIDTEKAEETYVGL